MDVTRTNRGAWRRSPILPRALTPQRGPTVTSPASWAEDAPEARRMPEAPSAPMAAEPLDPTVECIEEAAGLLETEEPAEAPREEAPLATEQQVRLGGCLCGAVRYETMGRPKLVELCHCADCRKASGGYAAHYGIWPAAEVRLNGRLAIHAGRSFCPCCGSHVAHVGPHTVTVLLGTLDEAPNDLMPERELWIIRREPWAAPVPGAMQFERDPI